MRLFQLAAYKPCFYGFSKLITLQVCLNHLREATHNTVNFWHFQVPVDFLVTPNIVNESSPC